LRFRFFFATLDAGKSKESDPMLALESFVRERGLPAMLSTELGRRGLSDWTPLQARAWRAGADRPDSDWLVTAPTSAGKSLVAELRSARHLARSEKVVWLAPTRALADATARQLAADFAPCGWRVALATGDAPDGDAALARGSFDLLVTVPEKALAWLAREPHALAGVGLVVVDELPLLGDPERGPRFDLLLALIRHSPYAPRRLALAPPLGEGRAAAAWWGGRWLDEPSRPRPLHEGVLDVRTGRFRWRDRAAGEAGELPLIPPEVLLECLSRAAATVGIDDHPPLRALTGALAGTLAARGEPTLLFAPTRAMARTWALGLAGALEPTLDPELLGRLNRLARLEPCSDLAAAAAAAAGGVGLHHADLPAPARQAVEEAFTDGKLNLVVATPTLAHGVNLRARNVVLWPQAPGGGPRRAAWLPLERYHDQAGRAGRMGWGEGPGRSILVAWDGAAAERLWDRFIAPPPPPLRSALALAGLAPLLPPALAGDVARTRPNLLALMASTLGGTQRPADELGGLEWALDQALADCDAAHLLRPRADAAEPHRLSSRGQIAALHGLAPGQARHLGRVAEESPPGEDPLPCLWGLARGRGVPRSAPRRAPGSASATCGRRAGSPSGSTAPADPSRRIWRRWRPAPAWPAGSDRNRPSRLSTRPGGARGCCNAPARRWPRWRRQRLSWPRCADCRRPTGRAGANWPPGCGGGCRPAPPSSAGSTCLIWGARACCGCGATAWPPWTRCAMRRSNSSPSGWRTRGLRGGSGCAWRPLSRRAA